MGSSDGDTFTDATEPAPTTGAPRLSLPNYGVKEVIGRGGMGEVLLARDARIGRDIAIKRMAAAQPSESEVTRFLREARIQARLEHPAIVPVHEIGEDTNGRPFFTMKRLAGTTLHDVLRDPEAKLQPLLRAFVDVCLAVQLAHENGVIHRDLKPGNIMLGNFGEVYVLDWGVARVIDEAELSRDATIASGETDAGSMLGTIGYMAPEQMSDAASVGPAADVYALGATLYEILTRVPLHPRGVEGIASTMTGAIVAPRERRQDVAPELDAACMAALARDPAQRPTARALGERISRYLDGDRDLEQRRALAAQYFATARDAASDPARRAEAIHAAGRAVGFDPQSDAVALLTRLLVEPPAVDPPALSAKLVSLDTQTATRGSRLGAMMLLGALPIIALIAWTGVKNWTWIGVLAVAIVLNAAWAYRQSRKGRSFGVLAFFGSCVLTIAISRFAGPYLVTPLFICAMAMALAVQPKAIDMPAWAFLALAAFGFLLPLALEATGVVPSTYAIAHDRMTITSDVLHFDGLATELLIAIPNLAVIALASLFARHQGAAYRQAQHDLARREWHLEQLLPK